MNYWGLAIVITNMITTALLVLLGVDIYMTKRLERKIDSLKLHAKSMKLLMQMIDHAKKEADEKND